MQKSDRNRENKKIWEEPPIATRSCPRCGNAKTRRSSRRTSDGLLKKLLYKSYRCRACRHRFWVMNPLRLSALVVGIMLVLAPFFGILWMNFNRQPVSTRSSSPSAAAPISLWAASSQQSGSGNISEAAPNEQIKNLAEQGNAEAELQIGLRYASTTWGIRNDKMAAKWFEKAARHDKVEAQYRYGLALLKGQGVIQDYKAAFYWLEKAAQQGHAQAQFAFGEMYQGGIGIKSDIERAYFWFNMAAAQGVEKAVSSRDLVVQQLTPSQIDAMQEEAGRISRSQHSE